MSDDAQPEAEIDRKYEQFEEKSDELWDGLEEAYAAGFLKAVESFDIDAPTPDTVQELRENQFVSESHYYYWDGKTLPLEFWLEEQFGVGSAATEGDDAE